MKLNHSKWRCTAVVQQTRVSQTLSVVAIVTGHSKEQLAITVNRYYLVKRSCIHLEMFADYLLSKGTHTRPREVHIKYPEISGSLFMSPIL